MRFPPRHCAKSSNLTLLLPENQGNQDESSLHPVRIEGKQPKDGSNRRYPFSVSATSGQRPGGNSPHGVCASACPSRELWKDGRIQECSTEKPGKMDEFLGTSLWCRSAPEPQVVFLGLGWSIGPKTVSQELKIRAFEIPASINLGRASGRTCGIQPRIR